MSSSWLLMPQCVSVNSVPDLSSLLGVQSDVQTGGTNGLCLSPLHRHRLISLCHTLSCHDDKELLFLADYCALCLDYWLDREPAHPLSSLTLLRLRETELRSSCGFIRGCAGISERPIATLHTLERYTLFNVTHTLARTFVFWSGDTRAWRHFTMIRGQAGLENALHSMLMFFNIWRRKFKS